VLSGGTGQNRLSNKAGLQNCHVITTFKLAIMFYEPLQSVVKNNDLTDFYRLEVQFGTLNVNTYLIHGAGHYLKS
jgi:hypothetical protein